MCHKIMGQQTLRQSQVTMSADTDDIEQSNQKHPQRQQQRRNNQIMKINYIFFIIHMKNDFNHSNETSIKFIKISSKIHH
jgi:hypothetical protein